MAKLDITLDTEAKTMKVSVDGKDVGAVDSVSVYSYFMGDDEDREPHFEISKTEYGDSVRTYTRVCASRAAAKYDGEKTAFASVPGYVQVRETKDEDEVRETFASLFGRGRRAGR